MEFMDISSLGTGNRYVVKIKQKLKQKTQKFGHGKPTWEKPQKGGPNLKKKGQSKDGEYQENQSKPQENKDTRNTKKDTRKWCDFHKIPWHKTVDCLSKK